MVGSTFISVPETKANVASLAASLQALHHNVNQLIASSQALGTKNLSGSKVFALQGTVASLAATVNGIASQSSSNNSSVSNHDFALTAIENEIATLQVSVTSLNALLIPATVVAGLPAPSVNIGARSTALDANTTLTAGIGTVVVGGGANVVPVFCDGTNWLIG